jgi:hypothetical protein
MRGLNRAILARVLSIVGALVLALTFVVHDHYGEKAKDSVSELRILDLQDDIRQRFAGISQQLGSITAVPQTKSKEGIVVEFQNLPTKKNEADRAVSYYETRLKVALDQYYDIGPLIEVVKSDKSQNEIQKTSLAHEEEAVNVANQACEDAYDKFYPGAGLVAVNPKDRDLTPKESESVTTLGEQILVVEVNVSRLSNLVHDAADDKMKRDKASDKRFTSWTYFLYPLGSVLIIVGKILEPIEKANDLDL